MIKMTVITDETGKLLGAVRNDLITNENVRFSVSAQLRPGQKHHQVEVEDAIMEKPVDELHHYLLRTISEQN